MSDSDKRQARQRALTIGACAAVVAFGGPLIAQRFGDQKAQEAYLADARVLAETIVSAEADTDALPVRQVSFSNRANPDALYQQISYSADAPSADMVGSLTLRARDTGSIQGLVDFTLEDLGLGRDRLEQDPLDCLSRAVYYEARSEDQIGQMAVAEVVMNRVRNPHYPKTVCDVVYQGRYRETGCQFTFTCDGSLNDTPHGESWDRARDIALHVLLGLNKPVTNKATHYHTDYVNPYWAAGMVETQVIGTHIFYRFPKTSREWQLARAALEAQDANDKSLEVIDPMVMDTNDVSPTLIAVSVDSSEPVLAPPSQQAGESQPL